MSLKLISKVNCEVEVNGSNVLMFSNDVLGDRVKITYGAKDLYRCVLRKDANISDLSAYHVLLNIRSTVGVITLDVTKSFIESYIIDVKMYNENCTSEEVAAEARSLIFGVFGAAPKKRQEQPQFLPVNSKDFHGSEITIKRAVHAVKNKKWTPVENIMPKPPGSLENVK